MVSWDKIKSWLAAERAELGEAKRSLETSVDHDLTQREQRLAETPIQAMERLQSEIDANSQALSELAETLDDETEQG